MRVLAGLILMLTVLGCKPEPVNRDCYKYTIWVGNSVFAAGHDASKYQEVDSWIIFKDKSGATQKLNKSSVHSIDENNCKTTN